MYVFLKILQIPYRASNEWLAYFVCRHEDDEEEEMADNFIEFDAAGTGHRSTHVKGLPEIINPQPIEDDDLVF